MPLFLDIHSIVTDLTANEVAAIHLVDDETPAGARCLRHWVTAHGDRMFCLVEADDAGSARAIHRSAAGLTTEECVPVSEHV